MWKIWHRLFGLHFIAIPYGFSDSIRLVRFDLNGRPYVRLYGNLHWLLRSQEEWEALTFDKDSWIKSFDKPKLQLVK